MAKVKGFFFLKLVKLLGQGQNFGIYGKVLSQGMYICYMKALPLLIRKLWPRLKFLKSMSKVPFLLTFYIPNLGSRTQNMTSLAF